MIDNKRADRSAQTGLSSRAAWRLLTRRRRAFILFIETLLILVVALVGHLTGRELGRRNLEKREEIIIELREELQKRGGELGRRNDQYGVLQAKLNSVQAALDAIVPSENTYQHRSQSIAAGRRRPADGRSDRPAREPDRDLERQWQGVRRGRGRRDQRWLTTTRRHVRSPFNLSICSRPLSTQCARRKAN